MKKIKSLLLILCCLLLFFSGIQVSRAFLAEPTVLYNGSKKEFSFVNVQNLDLYQNFKNVVPGDVLEQKILLQTERIENPTDIYLHTEPLNGIIQTIYLNGKVLAEEDGRSWLGKVRGDKKHEITVVLEVPKEAGNEIADLEKEVQWIFYACETTEDKELGTTVVKGEIPKTSDGNLPLVYMIMAAGSVLGIAAVLMNKKKA